MQKVIFIIIMALMVTIGANYIDTIYPIEDRIVEGSSYNIDKIGPGQSIPIKFEYSVEMDNDKMGYWDEIVITDYPEGWNVKDSKTYGNPLQITLTSPRRASEGWYTFTVKAIDEDNLNNLGELEFDVTVEIQHDIMDFEVTPKEIMTGGNQPAEFTIKITNKGATEDEFEVYSEGITEWTFSKAFYVPGKTTKEIKYEIVGEEEAIYNMQIHAKSRNSDIIKDSDNVTVKVQSNLINDYKATNNGLLIFPVVNTPLYAFMGLLSNLFP